MVVRSTRTVVEGTLTGSSLATLAFAAARSMSRVDVAEGVRLERPRRSARACFFTGVSRAESAAGSPGRCVEERRVGPGPTGSSPRSVGVGGSTTGSGSGSGIGGGASGSANACPAPSKGLSATATCSGAGGSPCGFADAA